MGHVGPALASSGLGLRVPKEDRRRFCSADAAVTVCSDAVGEAGTPRACGVGWQHDFLAQIPRHCPAHPGVQSRTPPTPPTQNFGPTSVPYVFLSLFTQEHRIPRRTRVKMRRRYSTNRDRWESEMRLEWMQGPLIRAQLFAT